MSTKAIEAEVSIQSGIDAEVEVGRGITVNVADVTLESLEATENGQYVPGAGVDGYSDVTVAVPDYVPVLENLEITENGEYFPGEGIDGFGEVLVNVPTNIPDAYVCEGTFKATTTGVLTVDTGYTGSGFAKAIIIHPDTGIMGLDDDFFDNAPRYAINALSYFKISKAAPTYPETLSGAENQMRFVYMFKSTETAYSTSNATVYVMTTADNPGQYGTQGFVRMPDNHTLQVFTASEPSGTTAYLPTGIRFKYQIFY